MITVYLFTIVKLLSANFNGEIYFFVKFCGVALKIGLEESQEEFRRDGRNGSLAGVRFRGLRDSKPPANALHPKNRSDLRKKASKEPVGVFPECPGIMSK